MIDRDTLTAARRMAHWSALERMRQAEQGRESYGDLIAEWKRLKRWRETDRWHGHRWDQVRFSLLVLIGLAAVTAIGIIIGAAAAVFTN